MSYESMAREEDGCDFPGCDSNFDTANGRKVAIAKDDRVMAFCRKHSNRLIKEGVLLCTLEAAQAEVYGPSVTVNSVQIQERAECDFINSLKETKKV